MALWDSYRRAHLDFTVSLSQAEISATLAGTMLRDFPARLPVAWRFAMAEALRGLAGLRPELGVIAKTICDTTAAEVYAILATDPGMRSLDIPSYVQRIRHEVTEAVVLSYVAVCEQGGPPGDMDFERGVWSGLLVMLLAHLDAFLGDSLRTVCIARPETMKSKKQLTWEDAVSCDGWEQLINHLTEQTVLEFGMSPIDQRVGQLERRLGPALRTHLDIDLLCGAENLRHIIVHNGGRASPEYLRRIGHSGTPDAAVGELIPVTQGYVRKVAREARYLASTVFSEVSTKFLGKSPDELPSPVVDKVTAPVPPPPHQS